MRHRYAGVERDRKGPVCDIRIRAIFLQFLTSYLVFVDLDLFFFFGSGRTTACLNQGETFPIKKRVVNAQANFLQNLLHQLTGNNIKAAGSGLHAGNDFIQLGERNWLKNNKCWWTPVQSDDSFIRRRDSQCDIFNFV